MQLSLRTVIIIIIVGLGVSALFFAREQFNVRKEIVSIIDSLRPSVNVSPAEMGSSTPLSNPPTEHSLSGTAEKLEDKKFPLDSLKSRLERCIKEKNQMPCFETLFKLYLQTHSTQNSLTEIESLRAEFPKVETKCHDIVHAIGRQSFVKEKSVEKAFLGCDKTCAAGCYHGVIEGFLRKTPDQGSNAIEDHISLEELESKINIVCSPDAPLPIKMQCYHGLGHAILFFLNYDLPKGIDFCMRIPNDLNRRSCLDAVFMQNVAGGTPSSYVSSTDYHYPCNVVADEYKESCYRNQPLRMRNMGLSYEKIAQECEHAGKYYDTCMEGLGTNISTEVRLGRINDVVEFCMTQPKNAGKYSCMLGVLRMLINNSWNGKYAYPFCKLLPQQQQTPLRQLCYHLSQEHMRDMKYQSVEAAKEDCNKYSEGDPLCLTALEAFEH